MNSKHVAERALNPVDVLLECLSGKDVTLTFQSPQNAHSYRQRLYRSREEATRLWNMLEHNVKYPLTAHDIQIKLDDTTLKLVRPYAVTIISTSH